MSAWGFGHFENDEAMDWTADLIDIGDELINEAFDRVAELQKDYLESDVCSFALAAAEVVAALNGKPGADLPEELVAWVQGRPAPTGEILSAARKAVAAVEKESELRDVWEDSEQLDDWLPRVADLARRLS